MNEHPLEFVKIDTAQQIRRVAGHNIDAFADAADFGMNEKDIKLEIKDGWRLFGAETEGELVAAIFVKTDTKGLLSKHTSIKIGHQGSGYSHQIKEYIEKLAREEGHKFIYHYCGIDNFRQYSLNESHGYTKTGHKLGKLNDVVEWVKPLQKK